MRKVLKVKLKGSEGFTRWDKRPAHAHSSSSTRRTTRACCSRSASELERRLEERGRLEWAREESRSLEDVSDERDAQRSYERLPALGRLSDAARGVALELTEWREDEARGADRPPGSVLPDQALVELARRTPRDKHGLEQIRGLPPQTLHRRADALLAALERGRKRKAPPPPAEPPPREPADAPLVSLAQALVRHRSMESGVAVELIATQSELSALIGSLRRGEDGDHVRVATRLAPRAGGRRAARARGGPPRAERGPGRRPARQPDVGGSTRPAGSSPSSIRRRMSPLRRGLRYTWRWPTLGFCSKRPAARSASPTS